MPFWKSIPNPNRPSLQWSDFPQEQLSSGNGHRNCIGVLAENREEYMDLRSVWRLRLPTAEESKPAPGDDLLAQEDDETRAIIAHYLTLADHLLSAETNQEEGKITAA